MLKSKRSCSNRREVTANSAWRNFTPYVTTAYAFETLQAPKLKEQ